MADHSDQDEVQNRVKRKTLPLEPVDRDKLRRIYEEQKEDSFIHPEPVLPEENIPKFEESPLYLKESGLNGPTHAGEGNTTELRETVFLGKDQSRLKRKKSHKRRSKGRDEEDEENLHALSSTKPEAEGVELVTLGTEGKGDNSERPEIEARNGTTETSVTEEDRSSRRSQKKKKKKRYLERHASESRVTEKMQTALSTEDGIEGEFGQDQSSFPLSDRKPGRSRSQGTLPTQVSMDTEGLIDESKRKSKKKKKNREDSAEEIFKVSSEELAGVETLQGEEESLWKRAKKKSKKKKKKITEKEVIELMTGQEVLEVEKKPPQIPTAAYVEMETSTITKSKETRALPPLLTKRAFSLNKIHTKDLQKDDNLPATLRDDSALVGKSIPPISSVIGRGKEEILKREEEKEISDEEKSKPLLRGSLRSLRDAEEGRPQDQEKKEPEVPEFQRLKCLNPCCAALCRFWRFITKERNFTPREKKCIVALVTSVLAAIVFLGLFPSSFVYLDYHEYALKYDKVTGAVDRTTTYDFGCYILGPSTAFLTFSRSANIISKSHDVFTSDKITIKITYHTQYFLRKSEIGTLHLEFDTGYDSVIRSIVESEIKNAATSISVNNFRFQRTSLEKYFHNKIKEKLEGNCCQSCCPSSCTNNTVCSSCLGPGSCDQGYHITVGYFQLTTVDIPQEVLERYLQSILLMEYAETEELKQAKAVEDKITLRQTSLVHNEANEIVETGNAESQKIRIISEADREANLTTAYVSALSSMYTTLNVVQEDHKLSLMMLRVLEEAAVKGKLYRSYGYENETIYNRPLALPAG
ncbi:uncharacterized protein LOC111124415 isoform X2 [Crassostrea virginica]